jgi:cobalt-zinc-cadmium efflux system outer membrane protein
VSLADDRQRPNYSRPTAHISEPVSLPLGQTLLARPEIVLDDLLQIAESNNSEIRAACDEIGAAEGRLQQAGLYPNPVLELEAEEIPASDASLSQSENTVAISQPIILGSRRSAAVSAAAAEKDSRAFAFERKRREVLGQVYALFIELLYLSKAEASYQQLMESAQQTLEIARARYQARAVPEIEALKPELETYSLELASRRLVWERNATSQRLDSLLGGVHVPVDRIRGELPNRLPDLDLDALLRLLAEHPQMSAARKDAEAAARKVEQAKAERFPDVSFRLAYGRNAAEDQDIVEASLSIPLPLFDRNQGNIREAEFLAEKAQKAIKGVENALHVDLAAAHSEYLAACDQVAAFRDRILPAAEKSFSQTQEGYRAGKRSLLDLLDAQRTLTEARLSYLAGLREWNLADAKIRGILGSKFDLPLTETKESE